MTGDPRIDHYHWPGGREAMLRFGPDTGPVVMAALPLFEEANRTRAFVAAILRVLAIRGIGGVLPDVPGQGESTVRLETLSLHDMRTAFVRAADRVRADGRRVYAVAVRSGALIDTSASLSRRWHLAPQRGPGLLRELNRIKQAGDSDRRNADGAPPTRGVGPPVAIAGNLISARLLADLAIEEPDDGPGTMRRVVRLSADPASADLKIDRPPLWRRSEPGTDAVLAQRLADDIVDWIAACDG